MTIGRVTVALVRLWVLGLALLAACYSPAQPDCGFGCSESAECPDGYSCASDGVCHRDGTPATLICRHDARPDSPQPIDAAPPDADATPPAVVEIMPADNEVNVSRSSTVVVTFSEPVSGVASSSFTLSDGQNAIAGTVSQFDAVTFVFAPAALLPADATITVNLTSAITDSTGNALVPVTTTFQTGPT